MNTYAAEERLTPSERLPDRPLDAVGEQRASHRKGEDKGHEQRDHGPPHLLTALHGGRS